MGEHTEIAWTDHTWNPWWGCQRVSPGCEHCYAETFSKRVGHGKRLPGLWGPSGERKIASETVWREPARWNAAALNAGVRRRVFVASMADIFEDRPELVEPRARAFRVIENARHLDFLLLTKRPENMVRLAVDVGWYSSGWPSNVWAGTTCEDQRRADERIPHLLAVPAAVRFVSYEPALGPVDFSPWLPEVGRRVMCAACGRQKKPRGRSAPASASGSYCDDGCAWYLSEPLPSDLWPGESRRDFGFPRERAEQPSIDWIIVGGESGPGARPFDLAWVRGAVRQCKDAGVACFVKQLGAKPVHHVRDYTYVDEREDEEPLKLRHPKGGDMTEWPEAELRVRQFPGGAS